MSPSESRRRTDTPSLSHRLVSITEAILTWRRRRRTRLRQKAKRRGPILDWLAAFGSALVWVLVINQYVVQAYAIPSSSMEPTLLVDDRIFVDKFSFGPEAIPGYGKLPAAREPARGDIVVFESPEYVSRGPVFETLTRVVFMATLSLVNLDRDTNGNVREQFLIKRAIGLPGDIVRLDPASGDFFVRASGESGFVAAETLLPNPITTRREISQEREATVRAAAEYTALMSLHVPISSGRIASASPTALEAYSQMFSYWAYREVMLAQPSSATTAEQFYQIELGHYVPPDRFLPIGDNRDNSHDGRFFGPVSYRALLGHPVWRFWPLGRFGVPR